MSVRVDTDGEGLELALPSFSTYPYTLMCWFRPVTTPNTSTELAIGLGGASINQFDAISFPNGSWQLQIRMNGGYNVAGSTLTANVWYHLALVRSAATGTGVYLAYLNGVLDITGTSTWNQTQTFTRQFFGWGNAESPTRTVRGDYGYGKFYTAALTADEIYREMNVIRPVRTDNLYAWFPIFPGSGERNRDYSGNGRDFTENGTLSDTDPPPVSWGNQVWLIPWESSGIVIALNTASVSAAGQALTVVEGEVTPDIATAAVSAAGQPITIVAFAPPVTVQLSTAQISSQGQSLSVIEGEATIPLATALINALGQSLTVIEGEASIILDTSNISAQGQAITVSAPAPGAINIGLDTASITASGQTAEIIEGAVSIALAGGAISASGEAITISAPAPGAINIGLDTASITASGQALDVLEGAVSIAIATGAITAQGQALAVDAPIPSQTVLLDSGLVTAEGQALVVVPGAAVAILNTASLSLLAITIAVVASIQYSDYSFDLYIRQVFGFDAAIRQEHAFDMAIRQEES